MALIKCPECCKEISDKAVSCPSCGYVMEPKNKNTISERTETSPDIQKVYMKQCPSCQRVCRQVGIYYCPTCNVRLVNVREDTNNIYYCEQKIKDVAKNVPKCPVCQSEDIKKISGISKVGSVALWGIFSQKVKKQWHCNNCCSEW